MLRRQPLPRLWLMTDERISELAEAVRRLPRGAGIVFRHYATPPGDRRVLFDRTRRIARRRGLVLVLAGNTADATRWRADGVHNAVGPVPKRMIRTASVHGHRDLAGAAQHAADLVFVSPVFATRSHPGARALGRCGFRSIARAARVPAVALGGMDAGRARGLGAYGWAAIDAWTRERPRTSNAEAQKRKVVPK